MRTADLMSEAALLQTVREMARLYGYLVYHTHDSRRSEPGFPDLVLAKPSLRKVMYRELKTTKGKVTPEQQAWINALLACGEDIDVWRPADLTSGRIRDELLAPFGRAA